MTRRVDDREKLHLVVNRLLDATVTKSNIKIGARKTPVVVIHITDTNRWEEILNEIWRELEHYKEEKSINVVVVKHGPPHTGFEKEMMDTKNNEDELDGKEKKRHRIAGNRRMKKHR